MVVLPGQGEQEVPAEAAVRVDLGVHRQRIAMVVTTVQKVPQETAGREETTAGRATTVQFAR